MDGGDGAEIMKNLVLTAAMAAILAIPVATTTGIDTAQAAPPRVKAQSCKNMSGSHWFGIFQAIGQRGLFQDRMMYEAGCFTTQANCKAWLYWLRSDHGAGEKLASCKRRS